MITSMQEIVRFDEVSKTFKLSSKQQRINKTRDKYKKAVINFSETINKGEIYGLLGANGAGKTTTLRMLSTLIKPTTGDIYVEGISVKKEPKLIRSRIGFLTSELKLDDFFTPNYLFDYFSGLYGIDNTTREKRKKELFEKFDIESFKEVKIEDLSTGMKQKVSLIISIINNPDVLIFDEPTNGLDIITSKIVEDFLVQQKKEGKTILLSTHIFELVEKICDRVGFIIDGKLASTINIKENDIKDVEKLFFEKYYMTQGNTK